MVFHFKTVHRFIRGVVPVGVKVGSSGVEQLTLFLEQLGEDIILDSLVYMSHSNRNTLTSEDINMAIKHKFIDNFDED